jgi:hypothetical protein
MLSVAIIGTGMGVLIRDTAAPVREFRPLTCLEFPAGGDREPAVPGCQRRRGRFSGSAGRLYRLVSGRNSRTGAVIAHKYFTCAHLGSIN